MPTLPPIVVELKAEGAKLSSELGEAQKHLESFAKSGASTFDKVKESAAKYGTATGAAMTAAGAALEHLSGPMERSRVQLEQAVKNAGYDFEDFKGKIEEVDKKQEHYGHTTADTEQALQKLTSATGDPKKAIDEMGLAADIAAVKHISLSEAAGLVVKMSAGSGKVFKEFGINLKDFGGGADGAAKATEVLQLKLQGMAEVTAKTFSGRVEEMKVKVEDFAAHIGQKLAPVLVTAGPLIMGLSQALPLLGQAFTLAMGPAGVAVLVLAGLADAFVQLTRHQQEAIVTAKDFGTGYEDHVIAKLIETKKAADDAAAAMHMTSASQTVDMAKNVDDMEKYTIGQRKLAQVQDDFNNILKKSPEYAQEFIDKANKAHISTTGWQEALDAQNVSQAHARDLTAEHAKAIDGLTAAAKDQKTTVTEAKVAIKDYTQDAAEGLRIVTQSNKDAEKSYADHQKAVGSLYDTWGPRNAAIILQLGLTNAAIDSMAKAAIASTKDVDTGFAAMGDAVSHFGTQTHITAQDVEKFYKKMAKDAAEWETTVKKLLQSGLNDDIIDPLIKAGPKAAELAKATLAEVAKQGPEVLNALEGQVLEAKANTEQAVLDAKGTIIAASAEIHAAISGWAADMPGNLTVTYGQMRAHKKGGWVDYVPSGAAVPAIVHGGEFVLSTAMLAGQQAVPGRVAAAIGGGGGMTNYVTINAGVGTDPAALGRAVREALRADVRVNGYGSGSPVLV